MTRKKHSKPEVEAAPGYAESHGWRIDDKGSHAWGKMYCPTNDARCGCDEFCIASIASTPKNAGNHGKQLRRVVDRCLAGRLKEKT